MAISDANKTVDHELLAEIRQTVAELARMQRFRSGLWEVLPMGHTAVLDLLAQQRSPLTPTELAIARRIRKASITRALASLTEKGLIVRTPHPTDARQVMISITPKGRRVLKEAQESAENWYAKVLTAYSESELSDLRKSLKVLNHLAAVADAEADGTAEHPEGEL